MSGALQLVPAAVALTTCFVFSCFGRLSWKLQQSGSVAPFIAVVQAADAGQGDKLRVLAGLRDRGTAQRCVLLESKVRAVRVIIPHIRSHHSAQVWLVQNYHMVQQLAADGTNPPLHNSVLPRASECGS